MNNQKLYVGNLPYSATEQTIEEMFGQYGTVVSVKIITDRITGRSKGFGFVEMSEDAAAADAIAKLNGTDMEGRSITVNEARPPESGGGRPGGFGGGGGRGPRGGGGGGRGGFSRNRY